MDTSQLLKELHFTASGSSGPGGQHVNRTASKVTVRFELAASAALTESEKERLLDKLQGQLTQRQELVLSCSETRSQHKNKALLIDRLIALLNKALVRPKKRKRTRPGKGAVERRLKAKKQQALKKASRKKPPID